MTKLTFKYSINTGIAIFLVIGVIVLIEAISFKHHNRLDLTASKLYTLSDQSIKVLKSLQKDVKVIAFFNETQRGEQQAFKDLLDQYLYHSSRFSYEFVDPDKSPGKAKKYQITSYGTTVLESENKEEIISDIREEKLTNAILKLTRKGKKVIYFSKGHGEKNIKDINEPGYSFAKKAIEDSNYEIKDLVLPTTETVPEDSNLLIIAGPKKPILNTELETLKKYIEKGGKIFFMIDPGTASELGSFLEKYGIDLQDNIVVDKLSRIFGVDPSMPVVTQYGRHPIVKNFSTATFFPLTRSVDMTVNPVKGTRVTSLMKSSSDSWAEINKVPFEIGEAVFEEGKDIKGPISIGVVASLNEKKDTPERFRHDFDPKEDKPKDVKKKEGRIVVIGDSDFASNSRINILGNSDFFLNIINWLLEEEELISIRPKQSTGQLFTLSKAQQKMIFWIPLVVMPALFIISGITVYKKRKNMK
ncbi:MAG: Gldg family protein [Nitrospinota bacterium]|mgnify:FL=1|jgi:ABC-type uncharacterized transport system involved in gliding motility auxiliary subunit|nr:Gldg family protein [Nitrospinota bacterium]MDP7580249.1 Gldg family protein [Nitrospinota bacterium]HJN03399.1 Gldg family protein [Nitrospinota bacterium]